jgi:ABC-type glycerol-3-phosphate transport system permease component
MNRDRTSHIVAYLFLGLYTLFTLLPILWVFSTSLKPGDEVMAFPPRILPERVSFENYSFVFQDEYLLRSLGNSFITAGFSMVLSVTVSALAGYAFARYNFTGKNLILGSIMGMFMIPVAMNTIPLYIIFQKLKLLDTYFVLIWSYQILIIPLNIFLLKSYFETIPKAIEEQARIDGCSTLGVLWHITIPRAWPALAVSGIFAFRFSWNEFVFPLVFANKQEMNVFQVALYKFMDLYRVNWGHLTSCIIVGMIPILVLFVFFQKQMVSGFTAGAVKG